MTQWEKECRKLFLALGEDDKPRKLAIERAAALLYEAGHRDSLVIELTRQALATPIGYRDDVLSRYPPCMATPPLDARAQAIEDASERDE